MKEGRIRPSLHGEHDGLGGLAFSLNEGGSNSTLVDKLESHIENLYSCLNEGGSNSTLVVRFVPRYGQCLFSLNEGGSNSTLVAFRRR